MIKKLALAFLIIITLIGGYAIYVLSQPQIGAVPEGGALVRIERSPHFHDGKFENISPTPDLTEGASYVSLTSKMLFGKDSRTEPTQTIPSIKSDLLHLDRSQNTIVWFGHASYLMLIDGKTILVDPVFSGNASPTALFNVRSYPGTDVYNVEDLPAIDYLFMSGDHYDHLDYETILALEPKVRKVIAGLGVGAHFRKWGYPESKIIEKDWNQTLTLDTGFHVTTTSARHFSGRGLKRNKSLWMAYALTTPSMKIYIGGESGYDTHFASIGKALGPFDLAILECGQYNAYWKYIHMMPEQTVQAAIDLRAKSLMPVHWGKFTLALHAWNEPADRVYVESKKRNVRLITPKIGELVNLKDSTRIYRPWWMELQ
ncbi:MAG TPA: MBL fold metallo-hydrolase [Chryseolinea sp.]|nr:MBL fold metallo-hydrolase [Chryseolinea sp.]